MDFVTHLPWTQQKHDAVWVIVDRLMKSAHFLAVRMTFALERFCRLYIREIVRLHGVPVSFAWVPDLGSFFKLREVGVSPYLGLILRLNTMLMCRLVEALNGRLIGPKPWDRIDIIFGTPNGEAVN